MELDELLDALRDRGLAVTVKGDRARAQCPAHEDSEPSLSIRYDDEGEKILLYCFAGCEAQAIMHELDFAVADLFNDKGEAVPDRRARKRTAAPCRTVRASEMSNVMGHYARLADIPGNEYLAQVRDPRVPPAAG